MLLSRPSNKIYTPTSHELIEKHEVTDNSVQRCFNRSMKCISKTFLQARPSGSRLTVASMLKNLVASAVVYWLQLKSGTQFKSKEDVHAAICNLDRLTKSKAWIAPADPLLGLIGSKVVKDRTDVLPVNIELLLSDGEIEIVSLVNSENDNSEG